MRIKKQQWYFPLHLFPLNPNIVLKLPAEFPLDDELIFQWDELYPWSRLDGMRRYSYPESIVAALDTSAKKGFCPCYPVFTCLSHFDCFLGRSEFRHLGDPHDRMGAISSDAAGFHKFVEDNLDDFLALWINIDRLYLVLEKQQDEDTASERRFAVLNELLIERGLKICPILVEQYRLPFGVYRIRYGKGEERGNIDTAEPVPVDSAPFSALLTEILAACRRLQNFDERIWQLGRLCLECRQISALAAMDSGNRDGHLCLFRNRLERLESEIRLMEGECERLRRDCAPLFLDGWLRTRLDSRALPIYVDYDALRRENAAFFPDMKR